MGAAPRQISPRHALEWDHLGLLHQHRTALQNVGEGQELGREVRHVGGEDIIEDSLRSLEEEFGGSFVRVHRSALVAISQVESLEREADGHYVVHLRHGGGSLQVSRRLATDVLRRLR